MPGPPGIKPMQQWIDFPAPTPDSVARMMASTTTIGIALGLSTAFCSSCSYIASRRFVVSRDRAALRLLVAGQLLMGLMSVAVVILSWSPALPPMRHYLLHAVAATAFYLLGQAGMFLLMRSAQASSVSPLLGFKIVVVAVLVTVLGLDRLSAGQWAAVIVASGAAVMLGSLGGVLNLRAMAHLALACTGYAMSDLNIMALVQSLAGVSLVRASIFACGVAYLVGGLAVIALIPLIGWRRTARDLRDAVPFAVCWYAAMLLLFGCFATVGTVFGGVLQSTRGIMSVVLGAVIARLGHHHLEAHATPSLLIRRILAAALMTFAIYLFSTR